MNIYTTPVSATSTYQKIHHVKSYKAGLSAKNVKSTSVKPRSFVREKHRYYKKGSEDPNNVCATKLRADFDTYMKMARTLAPKGSGKHTRLTALLAPFDYKTEIKGMTPQQLCQILNEHGMAELGGSNIYRVLNRREAKWQASLETVSQQDIQQLQPVLDLFNSINCKTTRFVLLQRSAEFRALDWSRTKLQAILRQVMPDVSAYIYQLSDEILDTKIPSNVASWFKKNQSGLPERHLKDAELTQWLRLSGIPRGITGMQLVSLLLKKPCYGVSKEIILWALRVVRATSTPPTELKPPIKKLALTRQSVNTRFLQLFEVNCRAEWQAICVATPEANDAEKMRQLLGRYDYSDITGSTVKKIHKIMNEEGIRIKYKTIDNALYERQLQAELLTLEHSDDPHLAECLQQITRLLNKSNQVRCPVAKGLLAKRSTHYPDVGDAVLYLAMKNSDIKVNANIFRHIRESYDRERKMHITLWFKENQKQFRQKDVAAKGLLHQLMVSNFPDDLCKIQLFSRLACPSRPYVEFGLVSQVLRQAKEIRARDTRLAHEHFPVLDRYIPQLTATITRAIENSDDEVTLDAFSDGGGELFSDMEEVATPTNDDETSLSDIPLHTLFQPDDAHLPSVSPMMHISNLTDMSTMIADDAAMLQDDAPDWLHTLANSSDK